MEQQRTPIFTFALYFDHESSAVSVCVDTKENSARVVAGINRYNAKYFRYAVENGDLKMAALWQANIGRSLSLGDFSMVNVARVELPGVAQDRALDLVLLRAVVDVQDRVLALSDAPEEVLFACSSVDDEVAYVWSAGVA